MKGNSKRGKVLKRTNRYRYACTLVSLLGTSVLLLCLAGCGNKTTKASNETPAETTAPAAKEVRYIYGIAADSYETDTCRVLAGETLSGILHRHGLSGEQWRAMQPLLKQHPELSAIREGGHYLTFRNDTALCYYAYRHNRRETTIVSLTDSMYVWRDTLPVDTHQRCARFAITSSLWQAIHNHDLPVELALELSEIYAWTINFFALQQGDSVRVLYDEMYVDSARIGIGRIHAAHFYHGNRWLPAYYADTTLLAPWQAGSVQPFASGYYDEQGNSLRKTFLKAPLNYKRISSHFSYARKHPIYHTVRPHTGVDYAAPAGTPVVALGDGVVTFRAYKGGGGNTIKIRHNSMYETAYLHLQKYAKGLQVGQYVKQGEVIGYVGSTGASTGPHLDFRVWKNGSPVNPLTLDSPSADPLPKEAHPAYDSLVVRYTMTIDN